MKKNGLLTETMRDITQKQSLLFSNLILARKKIICTATAFFSPKMFVKIQKTQKGEKETLKEGSWASRVAQQVKVACWAGLVT